ncbi:hypothetical protein SeMB42_g06950 [Synchytrium endobioticum]|uniref:Uncharacterized protein n=1 Tax=Synchytrium endobioticum TaxID=286115 RepID=A0A507CKW8_9FUNG|nr:hypothetical protein SeMB42_g06950 [Synchytrium endobioticum]TPX40492.1 hypothetical protein SeLEV6574_g06593 [Synchytrium endobioticum]
MAQNHASASTSPTLSASPPKGLFLLGHQTEITSRVRPEDNDVAGTSCVTPASARHRCSKVLLVSNSGKLSKSNSGTSAAGIVDHRELARLKRLRALEAKREQEGAGRPRSHRSKPKVKKWVQPPRPALSPSDLELVRLPPSDIHLHNFLAGRTIKPPPTSRSLVDAFFVGRAPANGFQMRRMGADRGWDNPPGNKELTQLRVSNPYGFRNYVKAEESRKGVADLYGRLETTRTAIALRVARLKEYADRLCRLKKENEELKSEHASLSLQTNGYVTMTLEQAEDNDRQAVDLLSRRRKRMKALRDDAARADGHAKLVITDLESRVDGLTIQLRDSEATYTSLCDFKSLMDTDPTALRRLVQAESETHRALVYQHGIQLRVMQAAMRGSNAKIESEALIRVRAAVSDDVIAALPSAGRAMIADAHKTRARLEVEMGKHQHNIAEFQEQIACLEAEVDARKDQMREEERDRLRRLDERRRTMAV